MTDADLAFASIAELGRQLRSRALTSLHLTEIYLERIARIAPKLNAFITVTADLARQQARDADADLAAGRDRGPLHGIPYGVKDLVDTAYIPTTWGCRAMVDRIPTQDAAIVTRLREAGAVLLGKLSLTELANALSNTKESWNHNGPCRNPWDTERWAGGSSAGSGAATAAGLCAFAIGSETWGSIDCPSAFCGVSGLRPTFGTVPRSGALVLCPTLDKLGPLARSADDLALILQILAPAPAPSRLDRRSPAGLDPLARDQPLRIGVLTGPAIAPPGFHASFHDVLAALGTGAQLVPITLPEEPVDATTTIVFYGELYGTFAPLIERGVVRNLYDQEPWDAKWAAYTGLGLRADDFMKALYVRAQIQRDYRTLFEQVDVLLAPGRPMPAPIIDHFEEPADGGAFGPLNTVGNLAGLPGITLPMGFSDGMPISIHAAAAPYRDRDLLALGQLLQSRTDWHTKRPPIAS
jgi:aspartyl-tRNA(Asn)/glutamyl-tRNA(Gln) amidotransferase subunit A